MYGIDRKVPECKRNSGGTRPVPWRGDSMRPQLHPSPHRTVRCSGDPDGASGGGKLHGLRRAPVCVHRRVRLRGSPLQEPWDLSDNTLSEQRNLYWDTVWTHVRHSNYYPLLRTVLFEPQDWIVLQLKHVNIFITF